MALVPQSNTQGAVPTAVRERESEANGMEWLAPVRPLVSTSSVQERDHFAMTG